MEDMKAGALGLAEIMLDLQDEDHSLEFMIAIAQDAIQHYEDQLNSQSWSPIVLPIEEWAMEAIEDFYNGN